MKKQLQRHPSHSQPLGKGGQFSKYFHTLKPSTAQNLQLLWLGRSSSVCPCKTKSEHYIRIQKKSFQVSLPQSNRLPSAIRMGELYLVGINLVRDFKINHRLSFSASRGSDEDIVKETEFMSTPASSENPACHLVWPSKTRGSFNCHFLKMNPHVPTSGDFIMSVRTEKSLQPRVLTGDLQSLINTNWKRKAIHLQVPEAHLPILSSKQWHESLWYNLEPR